MKEEVFYKHVRETTFTKDYTVCGKVVEVASQHTSNDYDIITYELHIGVYIFPIDELFIKKVGCANSIKDVETDPLVKIKVDEYSLQTFLDFTKTLLPTKAVKKKVYMSYVVK